MHADEITAIQTRSIPRRGLFSWIRAALEVRRQHEHLSRLDDHALFDLGLSRRDVARELSQPFWMDPDFGRISRPGR